MQKKIIALAIAAAFSAPAFADTTVYGLVDAAVARLSADGRQADTLALSGGLAGSRLGVNSSEDLAGGMKALVNLEYSLDIQDYAGTGIGSARQEMLALAGGFGTVATGYLQTAGYDFGKSFDPTAGSTVSPLDNVIKGGGFLIGTQGSDKRAGHALAYISPSFSGLTLAVNYSTSAANDTGNLGNADGVTTKTTATLLAANYKMDKLAAGFVYAVNVNQTAGSNNVSEMAFGASYDLDMAKVFASYQTAKIDNQVGSNNTAFSIGATVPVTSAGTVLVSYAKNTMNHDSTGADISNNDASASGMTVGYLHGLSKTTTAYAAYTRMSQGNGATGYSVADNTFGTLAGGSSSSMIAVGLSKKF